MGRLIWLMGASGSGKDSLLTALRERERPTLLVAHRYITRPFNAGNENHIALSEHEFLQREAQGLFALSWQANGHYYGIGQEIDLWLAAGFNVVVNGSRAHLEQAQTRYRAQLLAVCLHVSPDILQARLQTRGRESAAQIAARLARAAQYASVPPGCRVLNNDGSLLQSVETLLTLVDEHHQPREPHHAL
ncbi:ribose 1,5-bisphosphokinase [Atlantibacter hermannii]|uniref:ribose 1,5-bisphosphokinase n=1 Tax=Atlantibacter hermannii TaxID=565 RepID=UPI0022B7C9E6|nr:ribose 1,5-bisphosphokinase [Atlantibacter hermannii]MCZ7833245.1 ribose 1,5-bisphosphokinase [Atlantibacter hermannii]